MKSSYLDDTTLIKLFIKGQAQLAANEKLRVQTACDTTQLIARNGQILAIAQLQVESPNIRVRSQSTYTELLDTILKSHNFLPSGSEDAAGFAQYRYYEGPPGYKLHCESARLLWRHWWIRYRQSRPQFLDLDLLIFTHQQWYPIRHVVFSNSTLFVTTYRGETAHQGDDLVLWADKQTSRAKKTTLSPRTKTQRPKLTTRPHTPAASTSSPTESLPTTARNSLTAESVATCPLPQALQQVARCEAGKIYIKTALGVIVIEGKDLSCHLQ